MSTRTPRLKKLIRMQRIRNAISKNSDRPRLCLNITSKNIHIQIITKTGKVLASASTLEKALYKKNASNKNKKTGEMIGELIGKRCLESGVKKVVFDRSGKKYHGVCKVIADSARKNLEF
jgi:large subunit ribosomal protein L18